MKKSSSKASNTSSWQDLETIVAGASALSVVLTAWFIFSIFTAGQNLIQNGTLETPNVYAAWVALVFGGYSWVNSKNPGIRQVVVGMFVALTTALLVWIFGMTSIGASLAS